MAEPIKKWFSEMFMLFSNMYNLVRQHLCMYLNCLELFMDIIWFSLRSDSSTLQTHLVTISESSPPIKIT